MEKSGSSDQAALWWWGDQEHLSRQLPLLHLRTGIWIWSVARRRWYASKGLPMYHVVCMYKCSSIWLLCHLGRVCAYICRLMYIHHHCTLKEQPFWIDLEAFMEMAGCIRHICAGMYLQIRICVCMYVCTYVCMYRYAPKTGATPVARDLIFQRRQLIFGFIVGKLMVKWGLHVHTRIHDIMYINGRL